MKFLITTIFILSFCAKVESQVLVLESLSNKVVLGPNNVSITDTLICLHYLEQMKLYNTQLEFLKTGEEEKLAKQSKKKRIKEINLEIAKIELDIKWLEEINLLWISKLEDSKKQNEFYELWSKDNCYKIISNAKEFAPEEYSIEIKDIPTIFFKEFFKVTLVKGGGYWKKTKRIGCNSNKEDCYVLCWNTKPDSYSFTDIQGKDMVLLELNKDSKYSTENQHYEQNFKISNPTKIIKFLSKETGELIQVENWELMDCN